MPRVLIVDDAIFMQHTLKTIIEPAGYEVVGMAENGEVAIEMYKKLSPDIVTMDITMPEMTGIEAVRFIKRYDPNAKIVMISAMGQDRLIKQAIVYGATHFIVKPFSRDKVLETLQKVSDL